MNKKKIDLIKVDAEVQNMKLCLKLLKIKKKLKW